MDSAKGSYKISANASLSIFNTVFGLAPFEVSRHGRGNRREGREMMTDGLFLVASVAFTSRRDDSSAPARVLVMVYGMPCGLLACSQRERDG